MPDDELRAVELSVIVPAPEFIARTMAGVTKPGDDTYCPMLKPEVEDTATTGEPLVLVAVVEVPP